MGQAATFFIQLNAPFNKYLSFLTDGPDAT